MDYQIKLNAKVMQNERFASVVIDDVKHIMQKHYNTPSYMRSALNENVYCDGELVGKVISINE